MPKQGRLFTLIVILIIVSLKFIPSIVKFINSNGKTAQTTSAQNVPPSTAKPPVPVPGEAKKQIVQNDALDVVKLKARNYNLLSVSSAPFSALPEKVEGANKGIQSEKNSYTPNLTAQAGIFSNSGQSGKTENARETVRLQAIATNSGKYNAVLEINSGVHIVEKGDKAGMYTVVDINSEEVTLNGPEGIKTIQIK